MTENERAKDVFGENADAIVNAFYEAGFAIGDDAGAFGPFVATDDVPKTDEI